MVGFELGFELGLELAVELAVAGLGLRGLKMSKSFQEDERGWERSRPRCRNVGVYFGTFDPIHENHLGLASFAPHGLHKSLSAPKGATAALWSESTSWSMARRPSVWPCGAEATTP